MRVASLIAVLLLAASSAAAQTVQIECAEDPKTSVEQLLGWWNKIIREPRPVVLTDRLGDDLLASRTYSRCPVDVWGRVDSRSFTPAERAAVDRSLARLEPLLRCHNHPVNRIGRVSKAVRINTAGTCELRDDIAGGWLESSGAGGGVLAIYDRALQAPESNADATVDLDGVITHELAHALLSRFDPRTCTSYRTARQNPLMQAWIRETGWDPTGMRRVATRNREEPPADYARRSADEDLAESVRLYFKDPEALLRKSPGRFLFIAGVIQEARKR